MENKTLLEHWAIAKNMFEKRQLQGKPEFPTGLSFLDEATDGVHPGEIWMIGARPSQGKTTLALQFARSFAENPSHHLLFLSLEMPGWSLVSRMFCEMQKIKYKDLRIGLLPPEYVDKEKSFRDYLTKIDFEVYESGFTIKEINSILKSAYEKKKPDVVVIDFVQLIEWISIGNERMALAEYMRNIKKIAKETNTAFIIASQLRRLPAGTPSANREPELGDLYGSGALEAAADNIIFLYSVEENEEIKHFLKLAKQRQGEPITREIAFLAEYFKFQEISQEEVQPVFFKEE